MFTPFNIKIKKIPLHFIIINYKKC